MTRRTSLRRWSPLPLLAILLANSGCSPVSSNLRTTAEQFAVHLSALEISSDAGAAAEAELRVITGGMDVPPRVRVVKTNQQGAEGTVTWEWTWPLPAGVWTYRSTSAWRTDGGGAWQPQWAPQLVHPEVDSEHRLVSTRLTAHRGDIAGANGRRLVHDRDVQVIGIDKSRVASDQAEASARRLARLLHVNADDFTARVRSAGEESFVPALTIRGGTPELPRHLAEIPGAYARAERRMLAPTATFSRNVIGTVRQATQEDIARSSGAIGPGDLVGVSGLQARYDEQLRGQDGVRVASVARSSGQRTDTLFELAPRDGVVLATTIDERFQLAAEKALDGIRPASALVAVRPSTGEIVAAADGTGSGYASTSTTGRYAPGSTFKIVSSLAAMRAGVDPDAPVECSRHVTVDGRQFKNYQDFPSDKVGQLSLIDVIAYSCNTGIIRLHDRVDGASVREAAHSLGAGRDFDAGFAVFYGSAPDPVNAVGNAEAMIGQGLIEMSPVAMAGVAASVSAGRTTIPFLIADQRPKPQDRPISSPEADQLRRMMGAVVDHGSGRFLQGLVDGAKTGTAEYGTDTPPRTHAWMIAYRDDLAVAVMIDDGASGSGIAGPPLRTFLQETA